MSAGSVAKVVIVGAGPAGLNAAVVCAEAGVPSLILDEKPGIGGAIYGGETAKGRKQDQQAARLFAAVKRLEAQIEISTESSVVGYFAEAGEIAYLKRGELVRRRAGRVILATGCYERPQPFPGWELPGSMTVGAAQLHVKAGLVKPGRRVVLAGTGPLLLAAAKQLHEAGVEVVSVFEAGRRRDLLRHPLRLLSGTSLLLEGLGYVNYLARHGIPLRFSWGVVEAKGKEMLEEVVVAPYDREWRPEIPRSLTLQADCLAVEYGFVSRTELAQLLGCRQRFDKALGWVPVTDEWQRSSPRGIYVAGDGAGVYGAEAAAIQGRIAATACLVDGGLTLPPAASRALARDRRRLAALKRFRRGFEDFSRLRAGLLDLPAEDTVICRCENVRLKEIRKAVEAGARDLASLKMGTRVGMGDCQGKVCGPFCHSLLAREGSAERAGFLRARFPLSPLPFSSLEEG